MDRTARTLRPWLAGCAIWLATGVPHWVGLYGYRGIGDMYLYRAYAYYMHHGEFPYHNFFFDWAPGSVPAVYFPSLLPYQYYVSFHAFAAVYALVGLLALSYTLVRLGASPRRVYLAVAAAAIAPLALGAISIDSLDYWPALFTGLGLAALVAERDRLGYGLLGFAVVAKVYPVVMLPVLLIWTWRRRSREEAIRCTKIGAAVVVLVSLPFLIMGFTGLGFSIKSQLVRGLQMESLGASILLVASRLGIRHAHIVNTHAPYSFDVAGNLATAVGLLFTLVTIWAIVWISLRYLRGPDERERLVTACVALVTAYVAFGRVLSPQYIVWLIPLVPLVGGRAGVFATGFLLAACGVTETWFPERFVHLQHVSPVSWFVLLRNLLLVATFVATAWPLRLQRHQVEARLPDRPRDQQEPQRREEPRPREA